MKQENPKSKDLHLYRIIMKLINATLQHAEGNFIETCTELNDKYIRAHYANNCGI